MSSEKTHLHFEWTADEILVALGICFAHGLGREAKYHDKGATVTKLLQNHADCLLQEGPAKGLADRLSMKFVVLRRVPTFSLLAARCAE